MAYRHVVVWIDHAQAHIIHFNAASSELHVIANGDTHSHLHHKAGVIGSGHEHGNQTLFDQVARAVADAEEILVVGPGGAKQEWVRRVAQHAPAVHAHIVGVETVDHPSDGQLLAYARRYFVAADRMRN